MRLRKRLAATALSIVMVVSSIQISGGISYAAELADGIAIGQDSPILITEETEGAETAKPDEGALTDGDSQTDHENVSEEETDAGQVSGNDAGEPAQSVDTEETEAKGTEIVEAEIKGAYQFDDAPSNGGMSVFSVSTYDNSVEDYLYQQMLKHADRIDISAYNVSVSDMGSLVSGVLNEHPDLYFVNRMYNYGYGPSFETIADLYMTYSTDYDDAAFKRKAEAALACVTDGMSDDMKATVLHDYLVINVEYDYDNYLSGNIPGDSYNAYGTLVNGTAVCNGYALAYKYLLNRVGIECYMVTSRSMNHAWNMVKLDGEYYHVDTTWDDPVRDMVGRVCHTNLFRSDANFGEHYGWAVTSGSGTVDYIATDTKYENAFWTDSDSPLVFDGTDCYYISNTGMSLKKTSFSNINATGTNVVSVGRWMSGSGGYWVGAFSGLYMINGRLFYNDGNSIYSIKPNGTDKKTEFTPEKTGSNQIYYSAYRNGQVVYALQTRPNLSAKQTVLTAEIEGVGEPETPPSTEGTYSITYVLDGGTNDRDNPATYTAGTQTIVLKDAAKVGYKFEGWYKDSAYTQRVEEIPKGSTGDITLYAKWTQTRLDAENLNYTFTTLDDETVSSRADGKPKLLLFFRTDCYYCQRTSQDLSQNIKNFNGVDIYAIESSYATKEAVTQFKNDYGCDEIAYCYGTSTTNVQCYWDYVDIVLSDGDYGLPFTVFIDSQNRVRYGICGRRSWTQILSDLQEYCGYVETYKITYELNGGTNDSANPDTYTSETETITLKSAVKDGYAFDGWYKDAGFKEKVTEIVKGSTGDITLYAKWKEIPVEPGTYRIIYELNGGANDSENPDTYTSDTDTI
ncbi:MAG: InlB B-repeat-containing protein, partial [Lachnospiraceae bacterium]|nr:InlB B-repeat-containing protein [Lachnospiraceae bacterium]